MQDDGYEANVTPLGVLITDEDGNWHVIEVFQLEVESMEANMRSQL